MSFFDDLNCCILTQLLLTAASLEEPASLVCPDYQLRCPECPEGQACVYPDSGGCSGAGIPICQAIDCHGIVCLTKRLPWYIVQHQTIEAQY